MSRPSEEQIAAQKKYYDSIAVVQQQEEALKAKTEAALANSQKEGQSELKDGYFCIDRRWKKGDKVAVHFDMEPRTVKANNKVGHQDTLQLMRT